jgi:thymidylate synthase (FAD)
MRVHVLDHGYLERIEHWGSDERIVEAARMSTGKGFLRWDEGTCPACSPDDETPGPGCHSCEGKGRVRGDIHLIRRLWTMKHATPFEMAGMVIEVQAPIFVFREWHRHRTQSYNEMSARYTPLPDLNYIPTVERLMINAGGGNKQAGTVAGAVALTESAAESFRIALKHTYARAQALYEEALAAGVPKELARIHLPVARYSRMRASANLRNWLAFLTLRMDATAQWEIRQYANIVGSLIAAHFPRTMALFEEGRRG